jgi:hypothetical protein
MMQPSKAAAGDQQFALSAVAAGIMALAFASGFYTVTCIDKDGNEKWRDTIENQWASQGAEAVLTHAFKGSAYTSAMFLGLIESTGFSAYARTNTMANISAVGGGSPANGWNEATSSMYAARLAPSFGTASTASANTDLATSSTVDIKGCFVAMRSAAGTAPTSTVGNTSGALLSMGNFTQGDKACTNGDTLRVTYTGRLTT